MIEIHLIDSLNASSGGPLTFDSKHERPIENKLGRTRSQISRWIDEWLQKINLDVMLDVMLDLDNFKYRPKLSGEIYPVYTSDSAQMVADKGICCLHKSDNRDQGC
ncbi:hypothetical protein C5167_029387 [Papaver somniferum]|nr:hypothetical protein C5167_029387 [Papaver somniferum]